MRPYIICMTEANYGDLKTVPYPVRNGSYALGTAASLFVKNKQWKHNTVINVHLTGDDLLKEFVQQTITTHMPPLGVEFAFVDDWDRSHIRVALGMLTNGNWSYLGTDALSISRNEYTMMIFNATNETTILHEFGHALGLHHEHLHPNANILWNKEAVYDELMSSQGWSRGYIDTQMFNHSDDYLATEFDPKSIMMYYIPTAWTLDDSVYYPNNVFTNEDVQALQQLYPPDPTQEKHTHPYYPSIDLFTVIVVSFVVIEAVVLSALIFKWYMNPKRNKVSVPI